jgi:hypothetical protein
MIWLTLGLAVVMFGVGRWGARNVPRLLSPHLDDEQRDKQERVMRRGARVLQLVAVVLACLTLFVVFHLLHHPEVHSP